jgi:hypothetical protein
LVRVSGARNRSISPEPEHIPVKPGEVVVLVVDERIIVRGGEHSFEPIFDVIDH